MPCSSVAARKSKGRRLQQWVRDLMLKYAPHLEQDDIQSRGMGQNGEDIMLSPFARKRYPFYVECKNVEKLNIVGVFNDHYNKYKEKTGLKFLVHSRNRQEPLVTMRFLDFMDVYNTSRYGQ